VANYPRPGYPVHINKTTAVSTVEEWILKGSTSSIIIQNRSSADLEVFFTAAAKDKGAGHGLTIPAGMGYDGAIFIDRFWTLAGSAVQFEVVAAVIP
jgi:hypothetical protein